MKYRVFAVVAGTMWFWIHPGMNWSVCTRKTRPVVQAVSRSFRSPGPRPNKLEPLELRPEPDHHGSLESPLVRPRFRRKYRAEQNSAGGTIFRGLAP
jgi:hypothetical protein